LSELTRDEILRGRLTLWQPREGYRFSVDPLLLIDFVRAPFARCIDFCAGVGVIGLGLGQKQPEAKIVLVELQERLAELARKNADENGLGARVEVVKAEIGRDSIAGLGAAFDLAVANPPYRTMEEGPPSPDPESAIAQHELRLKLPTLTAEMRRALEPQGRAAIVYPAPRIAALLQALESQTLRPLRVRFVHPRADEPANRVLVEARKGARGPLVIEPPLFLRDENNQYTTEARRALGER
jgi:tRNA1Val (adenine37-N6)-methyltransferase